MNVGSLCTGYGGLELGLWPLFRARTAWVSDNDPAAARVLAYRFPRRPNLGDITKVDWADVPPVDILTGGTPCQDISHAGWRAGMAEGNRSNLWVAMREAITVLRPHTVVWENVGGAYSARADSHMESRTGRVGVTPTPTVLRVMGRVLGDLATLGYDCRWHGLRASDVGAAHRRFRVFVVATDADRAPLAWAPIPGPQHHRAAPTLPTPRTTDRYGTGRHGTGGLDLRTAVALLPTPVVNDMGIGKDPEAWDTWTTAMRARHLNSNGHGPSLSIEVQRPRLWADYHPAITRWEQVMGRPAPPPTQPGPKGGPRLSARFTEWLMGLPDGWVTDVPGITWRQAMRLLGNGVVPPQATEATRTMATW